MSDIPPPNEIVVNLTEDVLNKHKSVAGKYKIATKTVNGKPYWIDIPKKNVLFYDINFNQSWTVALNDEAFTSGGQSKKPTRLISSTPSNLNAEMPTSVSAWSFYDGQTWIRNANVQVNNFVESTTENELKDHVKKLELENQELRNKIATYDLLKNELQEVRKENKQLLKRLEQLEEKNEMQQKLQNEKKDSESGIPTTEILDQASSGEVKPISKIKAKMKDPMKITHCLESAKDVNLNVLNRNAFVARLDNSFSKNCNPVEILRTVLKTLGNGNDLNVDPIERFAIDVKSIKFFKNRNNLLRFKIKTIERDFVDFLIKTQSKESGFVIKRMLIRRTRMQKMILGRLREKLLKTEEFKGRKICIQRYSFTARMIVDDPGQKKPKPYSYLEALEEFGSKLLDEINDGTATEVSNISAICLKAYPNETVRNVSFLLSEFKSH